MPNSYFNRITNAFGMSRRKNKKESPRNVSNNYSNSSEDVTQNTSDTLTVEDFRNSRPEKIKQLEEDLKLLEGTNNTDYDNKELIELTAKLNNLKSKQHIQNVGLGGKKNMYRKSKKNRRTKRAFKVHSSKKYRRARK